MEILSLFSFLLAFSLSLYIVPRMANTAVELGIVDKPDNRLKTHKKATPYLGGLAIYIAFILSLSITFSFEKDVIALLLASTIILVLGLLDDFGALSPGLKLLGQAIAVFVLIKGGIYIQLIFLPQWISIILTFLWLMGITNAVNIIDIKDGLASGVVFIASVFLFVISVINDNQVVAIATIAFAGSILGFLRYNWRPARIYLGDAGSMFLGFLLGALSINGSYTQNNQVAALAPILLLGVPIFDLALVSIVRLRKGMSPMLGSPDHFAHRLEKLGLPLVGVNLVAYSASVFLGVIILLLRGTSDVLFATLLVSVTFLLGLVFLFVLARVKMNGKD